MAKINKEFTKQEMNKIREEEKGQPIRKKWFKHKDKEIYKYQLDVFGGDFDIYVEMEK